MVWNKPQGLGMKDWVNFLLRFSREKIDTTFFIKIKNNNMLLVQIYVDNIIFSATNESLYKKFSKCMQGEFKMSMMGELNYLIGL